MILLRADAGPAIGVGHLSRCVALAEAAVARGHRVALSGTVTGADWLADRLTELAVPMLAPAPDDAALATLAADVGADVVVVDHYGLGALPATRAATHLVSIEDGEFGRRPADLVVDTNLAAARRDPDGSDAVLLGPSYALLRDRVRRARGARADDALKAPFTTLNVAKASFSALPGRCGALRVVVVMGGGAAGEAVAAALAALAATGVVVSVRAISAAPVAVPPGLDCVVEPPTPDLPAVCADADLVVSAAGVTLLELCCVGVPTALVQVADNQAAGYAAALRAGVATGLGTPADLRNAVDQLRTLLTDHPARSAVGDTARSTVDGQGVTRVLDQLGLRARAATTDDAESLLRWRNDEQTRAWSRDRRPVEAADHVAWLRRVVDDPDRVLFVVDDQAADSPLGTVRFDRRGTDAWEVSITLAPEHRGQGRAGALLTAGEAALRARQPARVIHASVHRDNTASVRLFDRAGYVETSAPDGPFRQLSKAVPSRE